jgi:hypothetical protein
MGTMKIYPSYFYARLDRAPIPHNYSPRKKAGVNPASVVSPAQGQLDRRLSRPSAINFIICLVVFVRLTCHTLANLVADMFAFQQAFLQESVEADVQNVRSIRYTRGFLSGEHTTHKARIQLWKPAPTELSGGLSTHRNSVVHGQAPSLRSAAPTEEMRVKVTRLVMYLDEIIISVFVTDDIMHAIPNSSPRTLRIRPSSHKAFNNPSSVKACVLGDPKRDISGGFRLDREGLGIDKQDAFDEFKWFELEFQTDAECRCFADDFTAALQQRRRERLMIEELKKKAGRGVKVGEL